MQQTNFREDSSYLPSNKLNATPDITPYIQAVVKIQRLWRRYIDLQVFKYYKDLVIFHNQGDPALIMKYINPIEAKLIDSASGIHIKFRLAGAEFPPTIYYKIFTHRPIQDICANAPRDYTKPYLKQKTSAMKNNRINKKLPEQTNEGWYERIENNGWRPVSNKHLVQMNLDYYYGFNFKNKPIQFLHSKPMRRQNLEEKRKRNKINWMKKMYKHGMLKAKGQNPESNLLIEEATKNLISAYDNNYADSIEDWEVDKLLEWTNCLNFDDYNYNWKSIGTTATSDKLIVERLKQKTNYLFERDDTFYKDETLNLSQNRSGPDLESTTPIQSSTHRLMN